MRIYFQNLNYQNKQILWSYRVNSNTATCLYKSVGGNNTSDRNLVNAALREIIGIEIIDDVATIINVSDFSKRHHFSPALQCDNLHRFFLAHPGSSDHIPPLKTALPGESEHSRSATSLRAQQLSLDALLKSHYGATLVYEQGLPENNFKTLELLSKLKVHSVFSLNLTAKVIEDVDYYYLRQKQMQLVRELFEEILIPSLITFYNEEEPPKFVTEYLLNATLSLMANDTYNLEDTPYEKTRSVDIEENYKAREINAKKMMQGFLCFIEDQHAPEEEMPLELARWLEHFKAHLEVHQPKLTYILQQLKELVICTGLMHHDFSKFNLDTFTQGGHLDFSLLFTRIKALEMGNTTLKFALNHLKERYKYEIPVDLIRNMPPKLYSLKRVLQHFAPNNTGKKGLKENELRELVDNIISEVRVDFRRYTAGDKNSPGAQWISHTIKETDMDLHICDEWRVLLERDFTQFNQRIESHKKERKFIENWKMGIIEIIQSLPRKQLPLSSEATMGSTYQTSTMSP